MIGVTIGIGDVWKQVAERAAARMESFTGIKCHVIDKWSGKQYEYPAWLKCKIMDIFAGEDSYFYFDADIWCMKPWKPEALFEGFSRDFLAVPAVDNEFIKNECLKYDLPIGGKYICAGLFIFGREHRHVFDYAESLHPNFGLWYDQTPINIALNKRVSMTRLPLKYAVEAHGGNYSPAFTNVPVSDVICYHFCSCGGDASRVLKLQETGPTIT